MEQLIALFLALNPGSLSRYAAFLKVKNTLEDKSESIETRSILKSLIITESIRADLPFNSVLDFDDPIATKIKHFNDKLLVCWEKLSASTLEQCDRMDVTVKLLETYSRNVLQTLSIHLEALVKLYPGNAYVVNTLVTFMSIASLLSERKSKVVIPNDTTVTQVAALLKNDMPEEKVECPEDYLCTVRKITAVYSRFDSPKQKAWLHYLIMFDVICNEYKEQVAAVPMRLLKACLYDKGKSAIQRLELFGSVFSEERAAFLVAKKKAANDFVCAIDAVLKIVKVGLKAEEGSVLSRGGFWRKKEIAKLPSSPASKNYLSFTPIS